MYVSSYLSPLLFLSLTLGDIPLIQHDDDRLVLLVNVSGQLLIGIANRLAGIDQVEDHIRTPDRSLGPVEAVELDIIIHHVPLFPHAGRVDDDEGLAVFFEADVDAIPRRAGEFR